MIRKLWKTTISSLLVGFLALNFMDYILTIRGVSMGITEINPVMAKSMSSLALYSLVKLIPPLIIVVGVIYVMRRYGLTHEEVEMGRIISAGLFASYLFLVANNSFWIIITYLAYLR